MIRQSPTLSILFAAVGLILGGQSVAVAQTTPQDPSYEDKWIETNVESSPFLELRNERDTDVPDVPDAPDAPDTPSVDGAEKGEETESASRDSAKAEETDGADSPAATASDTAANVAKEEEASNEANETGSEPDQAREAASDEKRSEPSPDESVGEMLRNLEPATPGAILEDLEPRAGPVDLHEVALTKTELEAQLVGPAPDDTGAWWWEYRYWMLGGLVVLLVTGMFFWSRRRRVTVIERNYPSAEDFFQDDLKRNRKPVEPRADPRVDRSVNRDEGPGTAVPSEPPSESLYETLNEHGFDEEHQALVERYYREGLTRREVAQESSLGDGEVGLVLDLADRIREDETHAERA